LGAGEETLGRQLGDVGVIAARVDPAALGVLDDDLGRVDVGDDDVHALIDETVGDLRLAHRIVPVTGDDDLAGDGGIHGTRTEDEAVGVVEDEVDGLAADEPDLPRLRHGAGGHAAQIVWLFHVAAIADRVLGITSFHKAPMWVNRTSGYFGATFSTDGQ